MYARKSYSALLPDAEGRNTVKLLDAVGMRTGCPGPNPIQRVIDNDMLFGLVSSATLLLQAVSQLAAHYNVCSLH